MKTFKRICLKDYSVSDGGKHLDLVRGEQYITSAVNDAPKMGPSAVKGHVIVFSDYWTAIPEDVFDEGIIFTQR